ncbi:MAG: hypothetical protein ACRDF0_04900 [Candidatus Limnocylindria bacterium]
MSDREYRVHRIDECVVVSLGLPSLIYVEPALYISPSPQPSIRDDVPRTREATGSALAPDQLADALARAALTLRDIRLSDQVFRLQHEHANARERALNVLYRGNDCAGEIRGVPVEPNIGSLVPLARRRVGNRVVEGVDL